MKENIVASIHDAINLGFESLKDEHAKELADCKSEAYEDGLHDGKEEGYQDAVRDFEHKRFTVLKEALEICERALTDKVLYIAGDIEYVKSEIEKATHAQTR